MDRRSNPFRPGAGAQPPALAGRDRELQDFDVAIQRYMLGHPERSILLSGLRGVGKTVLLRECERIASGHGWESRSLEAGRGEDSLVEAVAAGARTALAFGQADSGSRGRDMTDLLLALGEAAAERRTGVLFTIDEMQFLPKRELADLAPGATWEPSALDEALRAAGGYPYFLQEVGRCAWNAAPRPDLIAHADVRRATPEALRSLDEGFFRVRFDRATDGGRAYLRAMAAMGPGPHRTRDVAQHLGKNSTAASAVRANLIRKGLCYAPRPGYVGFTVPLFDGYLQRIGEG